MSAEPDRSDEVTPPPGPEEQLADEGELFLRYRGSQDPTAREELVTRFLPFARSLAMRYRSGSEPTEDLIQVANLGLVKAIDRFEPEREIPFTAFAGPTILGEIKRHFRDRVWNLRVPRGLQERISRVDEAIGKLTSELGRSPSVSEIAERLKVDLSDVLEAFEAGQRRQTLSLDQRAGPLGEESPIAERVGETDPKLELVEQREAIREQLPDLTDRERLVLKLRFSDDLTQSEIAKRIGVSQMHVSRILRAAIEKLRRGMQS